MEVDERLWITNGLVQAFAENFPHLYIGGQFTYIGPKTAAAAAIKSAGAQPSFLDVQGSSNASINAIVGGPATGWFVGGNFTTSGGLRNLVRIGSNLAVDTSWTPNPDDTVETLQFILPVGAIATGQLHVGGRFSTISGQPRARYAVFDGLSASSSTVTPALTAMSIAITGVGIYSLYVALTNAANSNLAVAHLGGDCTITTPTKTQTNYAMVDIVSRSVQSWAPVFNNPIFVITGPGNRKVRPPAVAQFIHVGGSFSTVGSSTVGGSKRDRLARLRVGRVKNPATSFSVRLDGDVRALYLTADEKTLFAGGDFSTADKKARAGIVRLNAKNGDVDKSWDASLTSIPLPLMGNPTTIVSVQAIEGAAADESNKEPILVGGLFATAGLKIGANKKLPPERTRKTGLVGLDARTGDPIAYVNLTNIPSTSGPIRAIAVVRPISTLDGDPLKGVTVVFGGNTTSIGGFACSHVAKVKIDDSGAAAAAFGQADSTFLPVIESDGGVPEVKALAISDRQTPASLDNVVIGGIFTYVNQSVRENVCMLTGRGDLTNAFAPRFQGEVRALLTDGNVVYIGGLFTAGFGKLGTPSRVNFAAINLGATNIYLQFVSIPASSDSNQPPDFAPDPNGAVNAIVKVSGRYVIGGTFDSMYNSGALKAGAAVLGDANLPTDFVNQNRGRGFFDPGFPRGTGVTSFATCDSDVFIGADDALNSVLEFQAVTLPIARVGVGRMIRSNTETRFVPDLSWDAGGIFSPGTAGPRHVRGLACVAGTVYVVGAFSTVPFFSAPPPDSNNTDSTSFATRRGAAAYRTDQVQDTSTLRPVGDLKQDWDPNLVFEKQDGTKIDGRGLAVLVTRNTPQSVFIGGDFNRVAGKPCGGFAKVSLT